MKTLRNANYVVTFENEKNFTVENKFGDVYKCYFDENRKICSKQRFGINYAIKARVELGF